MAVIDDLKAMAKVAQDMPAPTRYVCTEAMSAGALVVNNSGGYGSLLADSVVRHAPETLVIFHKDDYEALREVMYAQVVKLSEPVQRVLGLAPMPPPIMSTGALRGSFYQHEVEKIDMAFRHYLEQATLTKVEEGTL